MQAWLERRHLKLQMLICVISLLPQMRLHCELRSCDADLHVLLRMWPLLQPGGVVPDSDFMKLTKNLFLDLANPDESQANHALRDLAALLDKHIGQRVGRNGVDCAAVADQKVTSRNKFSTFGRIAADMSSYQRAFCDGPPPPSDRVLLSVAAPRAQGDGGLDVSVAAGRALQPLGAGAWGRPCNAPPEGMRRAPAPVHQCPRAPKAMDAWT